MKVGVAEVLALRLVRTTLVALVVAILRTIMIVSPKTQLTPSADLAIGDSTGSAMMVGIHAIRTGGMNAMSIPSRTNVTEQIGNPGIGRHPDAMSIASTKPLASFGEWAFSNWSAADVECSAPEPRPTWILLRSSADPFVIGRVHAIGNLVHAPMHGRPILSLTNIRGWVVAVSASHEETRRVSGWLGSTQETRSCYAYRFWSFFGALQHRFQRARLHRSTLIVTVMLRSPRNFQINRNKDARRPRVQVVSDCKAKPNYAGRLRTLCY